MNLEPNRQVYLASLGCARNQVDSEVMLGRLSQAGWRETDAPADADVIVVNTCSFIEAAIDEAIDTILALAQHKVDGRCRRLIVTGCLPERFREKIVPEMPEVDLFLGTGAFDRIVQAVEGGYDAAGCLLPDPDAIQVGEAEGLRTLSQSHSAYLKIAEGCSKHCTYCIIPKLRGRHKSRPAETIVAEARRLLRAGVKELVLVAQDTTAYGRELQPPTDLSRLLTLLAEAVQALAPGAGGGPPAWIRMLYGHPESIDAQIIRTVGRNPAICPYFDIPIQHAADGVLKRMGRHYTEKDLHRLFEDLRAQVPHAALRTTVIVGFPGETDRDFERLLAFVESVRFEHLGVFTYSDSEDLPSHKLNRHVSAKRARERYERLMAVQQGIAREHNQRQVGSVQAVLIETCPEAGLFAGRTALQAPEVDGITYVRAEKLPLGAFATVKLTEALEYDLIGEPQ